MAKKMGAETSLYPPLKQFFEQQGFLVQSEVRNCDLAAVKDNVLVIVELKLRFNLELVFQAIERQHTGALVYVAIPPARWDKRWQKIRMLCRRLGLGLLTVAGNHVSVVLEATSTQKRGGKKRAGIIKEMNARSGDYNLGGSTKLPLITAYRELALIIASQLASQEQSVRYIVDKTGAPNAGRILADNHYGWFERVKRGVYSLSHQGHAALTQYRSVLEKIDAGSNNKPTGV